MKKTCIILFSHADTNKKEIQAQGFVNAFDKMKEKINKIPRVANESTSAESENQKI